MSQRKKYNIVSKENEIKNTYVEIGKKVYQNKNKYMDVLGEEISKIDDLKEDIEELKQEIEILRTQIIFKKFIYVLKIKEIRVAMSNKGNFYVTTAIAYTSGKPHIGNTYEVVLTDAIARYKRQEGYDVFYMTGTDEHGLKIEQKDEAEGIKPKEYVDKKAGEVKAIWDLMNTSYNKFMRTTDVDHEKQVQKIFKKLFDQGDIYKSTYEGMYCTACESFWTKSQLNEDKCPDCGREVNPAKEEAYFFKMSKYADRLMKYYDEHPEFIQPVSRKNEMINNFLKPGLQDLCVSRTSFT